MMLFIILYGTFSVIFSITLRFCDIKTIYAYLCFWVLRTKINKNNQKIKSQTLLLLAFIVWFCMQHWQQWVANHRNITATLVNQILLACRECQALSLNLCFLFPTLQNWIFYKLCFLESYSFLFSPRYENCYFAYNLRLNSHISDKQNRHFC